MYSGRTGEVYGFTTCSSTPTRTICLRPSMRPGTKPGSGRNIGFLLESDRVPKLKSANKSSQPMPGGHRGFNRAPVARHGWTQRSVADFQEHATCDHWWHLCRDRCHLWDRSDQHYRAVARVVGFGFELAECWSCRRRCCFAGCFSDLPMGADCRTMRSTEWRPRDASANSNGFGGAAIGELNRSA